MDVAGLNTALNSIEPYRYYGRVTAVLGLLVAGFPNLLLPSGPQSGSASTNYPRAIEIGVNDYLSKPYQESQLISAIEALIGREL